MHSHQYFVLIIIYILHILFIFTFFLSEVYSLIVKIFFLVFVCLKLYWLRSDYLSGYKVRDLNWFSLNHLKMLLHV